MIRETTHSRHLRWLRNLACAFGKIRPNSVDHLGVFYTGSMFYFILSNTTDIIFHSFGSKVVRDTDAEIRTSFTSQVTDKSKYDHISCFRFRICVALYHYSSNVFYGAEGTLSGCLDSRMELPAQIIIMQINLFEYFNDFQFRFTSIFDIMAVSETTDYKHIQNLSHFSRKPIIL